MKKRVVSLFLALLLTAALLPATAMADYAPADNLDVSKTYYLSASSGATDFAYTLVNESNGWRIKRISDGQYLKFDFYVSWVSGVSSAASVNVGSLSSGQAQLSTVASGRTYALYLRGDSLEAQQGGSQKVYIYENTDSGETGGSGTVVYHRIKALSEIQSGHSYVIVGHAYRASNNVRNHPDNIASEGGQAFVLGANASGGFTAKVDYMRTDRSSLSCFDYYICNAGQSTNAIADGTYTWTITVSGSDYYIKNDGTRKFLDLSSGTLAWSDTRVPLRIPEKDPSYYGYSTEYATDNIYKFNIKDGANNYYWHLEGTNQVVDNADDHDWFAIFDAGESISDVAQFHGFNLHLKGRITLNAWLYIPPAVVEADSDLYVTLSGEPYKVADAATSVVDGQTLYIFPVEKAATQYNDAVTLRLYSGDRTRLPLYYHEQDVTDTGWAYSVQHYLNKARELMGSDTNLYKVATAMNDFGSYAQQFFGHNTDNRANILQSEAVAAVDANTLKDYEAKISGTLDGITYSGSSLLLNSGTVIRHYFVLDSGSSIEDYTFKVNGMEATPTQQSDSKYYIDIPDVYALILCNTYTTAVEDANGQVLKVEYSALSYAYKVLSMTEEQQAAFDSDENNAANQWTYANLKPLVQAMYLYNQAAVAYFNEVNSMEG